MTAKNKKKDFTKIITVSLSSVLFMIVLVWALMSANGKKIDVNALLNEGVSEDILIQTGAIRINNSQFNKDSIKVKLDGQDINTNENIVENIEPGNYLLELSTDGHNPWKSRIEVEPYIITDISPFLFPYNPKLQPIQEYMTNIDKVSFSEYGDFAYYVIHTSEKGSENGIFKLPLVDSSNFFTNGDNTTAQVKISNIFPEIEEAINSEDYILEPSLDNRKLIFNSPLSEQYIFDTENPNLNSVEEDELVTIERLLGYHPERADWFKGSGSLIIKDRNLLTELVLSNQKKIVISYIPDLEPVYGLNGDSLIFFSKADNSIYTYKDETTKIIKLESKDIPEDIEWLTVDKNSANFVVFKTSDDNYQYLNIPESYITTIESNIEPLEFTNDGSALLYKKDNNLYTFTVKEIRAKNEFETKNNLIFEEFDSETNSVKWNSSGSHILHTQKLEDGVKKLNIIDKNGENNTLLLESNGIVGESIYMLFSNKEMILLIEDTVGLNENSINRNNLYNLNLEIE